MYDSNEWMQRKNYLALEWLVHLLCRKFWRLPSALSSEPLRLLQPGTLRQVDKILQTPKDLETNNTITEYLSSMLKCIFLALIKLSGAHFWPSLTFDGKACSQPIHCCTIECSTCVGSCLVPTIGLIWWNMSVTNTLLGFHLKDVAFGPKESFTTFCFWTRIMDVQRWRRIKYYLTIFLNQKVQKLLL